MATGEPPADDDVYKEHGEVGRAGTRASTPPRLASADSSFAVPLVAMTLLLARWTRFRDPSKGAEPWSAVPVQLIGIAAMLLMASVCVVVMLGA